MLLRGRVPFIGKPTQTHIWFSRLWRDWRLDLYITLKFQSELTLPAHFLGFSYNWPSGLLTGWANGPNSWLLQDSYCTHDTTGVTDSRGSQQ